MAKEAEEHSLYFFLSKNLHYVQFFFLQYDYLLFARSFILNIIFPGNLDLQIYNKSIAAGKIDDHQSERHPARVGLSLNCNSISGIPQCLAFFFFSLFEERLVRSNYNPLKYLNLLNVNAASNSYHTTGMNRSKMRTQRPMEIKHLRRKNGCCL